MLTPWSWRGIAIVQRRRSVAVGVLANVGMPLEDFPWPEWTGERPIDQTGRGGRRDGGRYIHHSGVN